jgi:hypothetical protein
VVSTPYYPVGANLVGPASSTSSQEAKNVTKTTLPSRKMAKPKAADTFQKVKQKRARISLQNKQKTTIVKHAYPVLRGAVSNRGFLLIC